MEERYFSKQWLTEADHTSSFVMCFYDPNGNNTDYRAFIRIADCERSITIAIDQVKNKKHVARKLIDFIDKVVSVIDGKHRSRRFRYRSSSSIFTRIQLKNVNEETAFLDIEKARLYYDESHKSRVQVYDGIRLHYDYFTCDYPTWLCKLGILRGELLAFKVFLQRFQK